MIESISTIDADTDYQFTEIVPAPETAVTIAPRTASIEDIEVERLNRELEETEATADAAVKATLMLYLKLGEALTIARKDPEKGGYGKWGQWLKDRGIDENRSKRAIRLANPENRAKLEAIAASKSVSVTDFTLTEALNAIRQPPKEESNSPTFESVQELFAPWGSFDRNPIGGRYKYVLTGCRGGDRFFRGLNEASEWYTEHCREDNRLDSPARISDSPVSGAAPFAPPPLVEPRIRENHGAIDGRESIVTELPETEEGERFISIKPQVDEVKSVISRLTSSKSDEHYTPAELLDRVYDCFAPLGVDLDPCSNAHGESANVKANQYYTIEDNGLIQSWSAKTVFINPPYSEVFLWTDKLIAEQENNNVGEVLFLVKADTSTQWFAKIWQHATALCFVDRRLKFINADNEGNSAPFASAIAYFGSEVDRFYYAFESLGVIVQVINPEMFGQ